ncbi:sugar phosphate isomerase/epimerase family protein [Candidatus Xianfuyuplasma coldseepsis]|uniref:Sugar phosphate isomerase/epimerase n=1 Tax=Candidatus Xianfuyuplasma coldseepsis TaxID=2782163 RepID=A0A7L7KT02_9MOLU|nr:sugar phosphate isomerase/epimerase family protein [Xianfuyuplasma coldseepsis]QMS85074.1 sugar phosphate isomerase/epimerase [Xianfuyuplasma coldseepsis]
MTPIPISAFADEITPNFEDQLIALQQLGIDYISLRLVNDKNIIDYTIDEVKSYIKPLLDQYNIRVSSIGSPIGKVDIYDKEAVQKQFDKMDNLIQICQVLKVKYIRIFSYYNASDTDKELVLEYLHKLITYTDNTDIYLLHENEKPIFGDTAEKCLYLAENIDNPHFQLIFDPANFVQVGQDPIIAFDMLKRYVKYLHLKDALSVDSSNVLIGSGDAKVQQIVRECIYKGDVSFMTLEPHLVEFTGLELLENEPRKKLNSVYTPFKAFEESLEALRTMMK